MLHDAHFHLHDEALLGEIKKYRIKGIVNADHMKEYQYLKTCFHDMDKIVISAGIHPWKVEQIAWEEMFPAMEEVKIIGEIGLDNVWCDSDMQKQREVFEHSLRYASKQHKPVILHTKGMEAEVLSYIRKYKNTYLIHWYSCDAYLQEYLKLGCYFTVGPSVGKDEAVNQVVYQVPLDHLMIESDGIEALSWCEKRNVAVHEYADILYRSVTEIAKLKQRTVQDTMDRLNQTFDMWLRHADMF